MTVIFCLVTTYVHFYDSTAEVTHWHKRKNLTLRGNNTDKPATTDLLLY